MPMGSPHCSSRPQPLEPSCNPLGASMHRQPTNYQTTSATVHKMGRHYQRVPTQPTTVHNRLQVDTARSRRHHLERARKRLHHVRYNDHDHYDYKSGQYNYKRLTNTRISISITVQLQLAATQRPPTDGARSPLPSSFRDVLMDIGYL